MKMMNDIIQDFTSRLTVDLLNKSTSMPNKFTNLCGAGSDCCYGRLQPGNELCGEVVEACLRYCENVAKEKNFYFISFMKTFCLPLLGGTGASKKSYKWANNNKIERYKL